MSRLSPLMAPLLMLALLPGVARAETGPRDSLQPRIAAMLAQERLAGMVWSLVDGDRGETDAAGLSHAERNMPMRADQRVHVGSLAKTLVALGVLRLVSEGRLDLDAPVSGLLPDLAFDNPWEAGHELRLRHLLDHTAGLENLRLWQFFSAETGPDDPLISTFARSPGVLRLRSRPGEAYAYSNLGYTLAGLIIERTTGERYEAWLDTHLLAPLGMDDSTFGFVSQASGPASRLAWGHLDDLTAVAAMPVALRPAGQLTTTAADMARLAAFLMSDGTVRGRALVRPDLLRAMGRPAGTAAAQAGLPVGYGLGLGLRDHDRRPGRCHSGSTVGYHAMLCLFPHERKAFFFSINTDSESADYGRFAATLREALGLRRLRPAEAVAPAADLDEWSGFYLPVTSGIGLKRYADLLTAGVTLHLAGPRPTLDTVSGESRPMEHAGAYRLRAADRVLPSHVLLHGDDGSRLLSDGYRTYRKTGRWVMLALWISLILGSLGLLYLLIALPFLSWRRGRSPLQPAVLGLLSLIPAGWLIVRQPFQQLGDLTLASAALCAASLALPALILVQAGLALSRRPAGWRIDLAAAVAALQWIAILAAFGLVPLMLWR